LSGIVFSMVEYTIFREVLVTTLSL
jgi:hypothetical protein